MPAAGKNNKDKGTPLEDQLTGTNGTDFVDGKSGDDVVAGGSGDDWVKGGSGNDLMRYGIGANATASNQYDGGSGIDDLMLEASFDEWMRLDVQDDIASYLVWLTDHLNPNGKATGHIYDFSAFDLAGKQIENLRVEVDGVELNPEDEAVTLAPDLNTADEDQGAITANVLDNDDVPDLVRSVVMIDAPWTGSVDIDVSGIFTYSYDEYFQYLAVGESEEISFTYEVTDADLDSEIETSTLIVTGVNDAPEAFADSVTTTENEAVSVNVLANDTDIDASDVHTVDAVSLVSDGRDTGASSEPAPTVAIVNNEVVFTPGTAYDYLAPGESDEAVISYDMSDNNGGTNSSTLTVLVEGVNDRPVAIDDSGTLDENSSITVSVLDNDYDTDASDTLSVTDISQSALGGIASIVNDEIVFDTNGDFESLAVGETQELTLEYEISDNHESTQSAEITLDITGVNDAPIAFMDDASTTESGTAFINVLDNDVDVDNGARLTVTDAKVVYGGGSVAIEEDSTLRFQTDGEYEYLGVGQQAEAIVEYTMEDEHGATSTSAVFVTINGEYDAPTVVASLGALSGLSVDYASDWHFTRALETGSATSLEFGDGEDTNDWSADWEMGFSDESLFGVGTDGLYESVTGGFTINEAKTPSSLLVIDLFDEDWGTGAEFRSGITAFLDMQFTPYVSVEGGTVDATQGLSASILGGNKDTNGFTSFNTSVLNNGSSIFHDMPDKYEAGLDASIAASLSLSASAKGGFLGAVASWNDSSTLFDAQADFNIMKGFIDTQNAEFTVSLADEALSYTFEDIIKIPGVSLPLTGTLYDESDETIASDNSGFSTTTKTDQPILGLRLDIDDLLGKLPHPVGTAFSYLDYNKKIDILELGGFNLEYTLFGAGFNLALELDADSESTPQYTVDLLFDKPALVEGFSDPVMAIRNADWNDLPGIKSYDGTPLKITPYFNSQLDFSTDLGLNLLGYLDVKVGEFEASAYIDGVFDESLHLGPLWSTDREDIFDIDLGDLDTVSFGTTGYDQFAGDTLLLT